MNAVWNRILAARFPRFPLQIKIRNTIFYRFIYFFDFLNESYTVTAGPVPPGQQRIKKGTSAHPWEERPA